MDNIQIISHALSDHEKSIEVCKKDLKYCKNFVNNEIYKTYKEVREIDFADFINSQYNDGTINLSRDTVVWEHDSIPHTIINVILTTVIVNGTGYGIQISGGS